MQPQRDGLCPRPLRVFVLGSCSSTWSAWWELTVDHSLQQRAKRKEKKGENGGGGGAEPGWRAPGGRAVRLSQGLGFYFTSCQDLGGKKRLVAESAADDRTGKSVCTCSFGGRAKTSRETEGRGVFKPTAWWGSLKRHFGVCGVCLTDLLGLQYLKWLCFFVPGRLQHREQRHRTMLLSSLSLSLSIFFFLAAIYQTLQPCVVQVGRCSTSTLVLGRDYLIYRSKQTSVGNWA